MKMEELPTMISHPRCVEGVIFPGPLIAGIPKRRFFKIDPPISLKKGCYWLGIENGRFYVLNKEKTEQVAESACMEMEEHIDGWHVREEVKPDAIVEKAVAR